MNTITNRIRQNYILAAPSRSSLVKDGARKHFAEIGYHSYCRPGWLLNRRKTFALSGAFPTFRRRVRFVTYRCAASPPLPSFFIYIRNPVFSDCAACNRLPLPRKECVKFAASSVCLSAAYDLLCLGVCVGAVVFAVEVVPWCFRAARSPTLLYSFCNSRFPDKDER